MIKIEIEGFGSMTLELYPEVAPITVENFLNYVKDGFYDGLTFHRIYRGFMIQGGDPTGTGMGDRSLKTIKGEFKSNGVNNTISHERGVISMARTNVKDSASSQFFICHKDSTFLDGDYAAFGKVIEGFDTLDAVADVPVTVGMSGERTTPFTPVVIKSITIVE
ncbi:MAG: peptidylprolyl isomerase [Ruminococcaceae bacterium]|nr:peptidylprolyl isomerase [Oscillospiraceae bacterium]